jgi:hypothetical protein
MNLETILNDTYYIQIHKLTTFEYHNTNIMNWHRTLKCPAQDLPLNQLIGIYPRVIHNTRQHNSLQTLVREKYPSTLFVHVYAHKLNLILKQSVEYINGCNVFFQTVSGFASFFQNVPKGLKPWM